ncbi:MAG: rhombosortase [Marinobacter sp.]|nr:rhombosortase [Marinobacter sp.]
MTGLYLAAQDMALLWLAYDRDAILSGQAWRMISAHFVHVGGWHLGLNVAGLVMLALLFRDLLSRQLIWLWLLVSPPVLSLFFLLTDPQLQGYVGLSGLLHGLLVMCLVYGWQGNKMVHTLVLAVVVGKLGWELLPGASGGAEALIGAEVYAPAHWAGALIGGVLAAICRLSQRQHKDRPR